MGYYFLLEETWIVVGLIKSYYGIELANNNLQEKLFLSIKTS